ncbi:hypothetical protein EMPS_05352 [Entomortierella parvispora]|uniref:Peptidase A1 domain-containing protein n=1 Tax=Entomortierella parvispora TaxID=205924 RepID=A0A9P3HAA9_9FUNG|nr:hypothetical protein EMPS_05352 [Entomortierella parvispora]
MGSWSWRWQLTISLALLIHSVSTAPLSSKDATSGTVLIPLKRLVPEPGTLHHPASSSLAQKRSLSGSNLSGTSTPPSPISVKTVGRVGYSGHILIGSPPQRFPVLFDTGSDLALVISDHCQGAECPDIIQFSCSTSTSCVDLGSTGLLSNEGRLRQPSGGSERSKEATSWPDLALQDTVVGDSNAGGGGGAGIRAETSRMQGLQQASPPAEVHSDTQEIQKMQSAAKTLPSPSQRQPLSARADNDTPGLTRILSKVVLPGPSLANNLAYSNNGNKRGPPETGRWPNFYNQTYVDGSWGAGTFVRDQILIDPTPMGETKGASVHPSGPSHVATVTFLNVVQDNLGLVEGYDHQISGLLGLTRTSPTGRKTFLQELVDQKSLALPVVSMHLELEGGSFLLGGIDHTQYRGGLIYCPVTDAVTWQISLQGIGTKRRSVPSSALPLPMPSTNSSSESTAASNGIKMLPQLSLFQDAPLILDSGTSSLLIPTAASEAIHSELGGTWDPVHRTWFLPCEGTVDLIWWVSSSHGVVQPYESLIYRLDDGRCQSLIFGNQEASYWILGDTWLRGLYVVYDMAGSGRIGIAHALNHGTSGNSSGFNGGGDDVDTRILTYQDTSNDSIPSRSPLFGTFWYLVAAILSWSILSNIVWGTFS